MRNREIAKYYNKYSKNKYLCIGTQAENLVMEDNKGVRICKEYKYLGITLHWKRTYVQEINNKITKTRKIIACLNDIL
jgi:hypothetical protein